MINGSGLTEGSVIFPRKYLVVITTWVWHIRGLMKPLFDLMSTSASLKLLIFLGYATLDFHRDMDCLNMGGEPRK